MDNIPKGLVAHRLTAAQRQELQETAASLGNVLDHRALDVALKIEQIDFLPIRAVQGVHIPVFVHLCATAQRDNVQVGENAQQYFARQRLGDFQIFGIDMSALMGRNVLCKWHRQ